MLDRVPTVLTAQEILDKAFLKANKLEVPDPDKYHRIRKTEEVQMKHIAESTREDLQRFLDSVPTLERLPQYEQEVLDILVGMDQLKKSLANIQWAEETIGQVYQEVSAAMRRERTTLGIQQQKRRFSGRCSSILYDVEADLAFLGKARDTVRMLPQVHPEYATVVIAGFPNVGKSSLLAAWTKAHPEIAAYAFTTKNANVGHFEVPGGPGEPPVKVQVVDTPGLLDRPDAKRNPVERQAVAALRHTADAVLFLIDPTVLSGYSMAEQESLLAQVKREMAGIPLLVAETKADVERAAPASDRVSFSVHTGKGVDELKQAIVKMLPTHEEELERDPLELWKSKRDPMFNS
ncbi:MAG: GTPase [Candidatus Thermoplasmatota archaeon]